MEYAKKAESLYGKYLFVYFVGNGEGEERIHFAVSEECFSLCNSHKKCPHLFL